MKKIIVAVVALVMGATVPGLAADNGRTVWREHRQEQRIHQGAVRGELTPREYRKLQQQQRRIDRSQYRRAATHIRHASAAAAAHAEPRLGKHPAQAQQRPRLLIGPKRPRPASAPGRWWASLRRNRVLTQKQPAVSSAARTQASPSSRLSTVTSTPFE